MIKSNTFTWLVKPSKQTALSNTERNEEERKKNAVKIVRFLVVLFSNEKES